MLTDPSEPQRETEQYKIEIEKLFVEYEAQVYRCAHRGLSHQDAEEIVSSAFLALLPHWTEVREYRSPIMYVMRTALNLRADALQRAAQRRAQSLDDLDETRHHTPGPEPDHLDLRAALTHLSAREEQMTIMRYWTDLDPDEIAQVLGLHGGHVRKTLLNARERLGELLSPEQSPENQTGLDGGPR